MDVLGSCFPPPFCPLNCPVTHEEHMSILAFLGRLMGSSDEAIDVEADAIIRAFFKRNPDAAYRVTKLAMTLAAAPEPRVVQSAPQKSRNWFSALLERRDNFA
jgi:hypothetical protein